VGKITSSFTHVPQKEVCLAVMMNHKYWRKLFSHQAHAPQISFSYVYHLPSFIWQIERGT